MTSKLLLVNSKIYTEFVARQYRIIYSCDKDFVLIYYIFLGTVQGVLYQWICHSLTDGAWYVIHSSDFV